MGWSEKYKKSIDCNNPKGFSQRAHCQGRKKKMSEEKKDHEYSMARSELKTVTNAVKRLQKKMGKKGEGNLQAWVQSKITKAADYIDTAADYVTNEETKSGDQGLRDWFGKSKSSDGKKGWVQLGGKWAGKPCARQPGQTSTPKCGSSKMAANLSAEEEESARRRKNRQDPNQPEKTGAAKPTNVKTEEMNIQEVKDKPGKGSGKKDACYNKVKSRYSVWPSAYASGALVKCRKVGAANWGNKTESVEFSDWRDDFKAMEYEFIDLIKPDPLVVEGHPMYDPERAKKATSLPAIKHTSADVRNAERKEKINRLAQQGSTEGERSAAARKAGTSLPRIQRNHVELEGEQIDELKCWKGYKRKKGVVPGAKGSCVKENQIEEGRTVRGVKDSDAITRDRRRRKEAQTQTKPRLRPGEMRWKNAKGEWVSNKDPRITSVIKNSFEIEIPSGDIKKLVKKAVKRIDADVDGDVDSQDPKAPEMGEFIPSPDGKKKVKTKARFEQFSDWRLELDEKLNLQNAEMGRVVTDFYNSNAPQFRGKSKKERRQMAVAAKLSAMREDWQKVNKSDKTDGMSAAAVKAYRRENPGSKLKTAVTGDPEPGSKDAERKMSFCRRSKGQKDMHNIDCSKTTDKPICKARRRWNC